MSSVNFCNIILAECVFLRAKEKTKNKRKDPEKQMNNRQPQPNGSTYNKSDAPSRQTQRPVSQNQSAQQRRPAPPRQAPQPQKKKIRIKPNKEGIISLIILLLIAVIAITLVTIGVKAIVGAISGNSDETGSSSSGTNEESPTGKWNDGFTNISIPTTDVAVGELILVNFENEYTLTDTLSSKLKPLYTSKGYNSYYVLNSTDVKVRGDILSSLQDMIFALVDSNPETLGNVASEDRIIITSGYRTIEKQTDLYNQRTEEYYVANPGHSEHHTGYAVDIQVFTSKQKTVLLRDNEQEWMEAHCAEFGFIIRYDGSKFELTGILDEPWHYRYVGVPHATYLMESGLCMEEYLKLLRDEHSYAENEPLAITAGENEYLVYYVPASAETTTSIPIPPESLGTYTISGDNMNGFIITVEKAK